MKIILIWGLFFSFLGHAQVYKPVIQDVITGEGKTSKVRLYKYLNSFGKKEIRIEATNIPKLKKVNPTLGYGRDTTDDGKIDTWFLIDADHGLVIKEEPSHDAWGLSALQYKVMKGYRSGARAHVAAAYGAVFGYLLMSVSHAYESEAEFWRELIDIEEMILRLKRAKEQGQITSTQWNDSVDMVKFGLTDLQERFEKATGRDYWLLGGADILLWTTGGVVIKYLGKGLAFLGRPLTNSAIAQEGKQAVGKIISGLKNRMTQKLGLLKKVRGGAVSGVIATRDAYKKGMRKTFRALMTRNKVMYHALHRIGKTSIAFQNAVLDWKYIAFMGGLQLTTEAFANYEEVASPEPTEFAKNVLTHPDIMQNVSYMTSNAFLMTAASHGVKSRGLRFATCGFIALGNSMVSNLVIRKEDDYERIALDTSWEAIIGNTQIQIDLAALTYFELKAAKTNNPRLKLLGWAIVLVDQTAGFLGYSAATNYLNRDEVPVVNSVQLVPVLAEK